MQAREKVQASPWKTYKRACEIPLWSRALLRHGGIHNYIDPIYYVETHIQCADVDLGFSNFLVNMHVISV